MNSGERRYMAWLASKLRERNDPSKIPVLVSDRMEAVAFRLMQVAQGAQVELRGEHPVEPPYHWLGKDAE